MLPHSAGNCLPNGKYCYMSDLVALNDKIPPNPLKPIPELQTIETPLKLEVWGQALSNHPDYGFVHYIYVLGLALTTHHAPPHLPRVTCSQQPNTQM